jgi:drug/metabolite transporter (DMT)-like permease
MASLYILLAIFLWSSLGVVVRLSGVEIHTLMFFSLVVALSAQGMLLSQKKYRREFPAIRKLQYPFILGLVSLVNSFAFFYAFKNTTIANAVLTHYTAPVIVAFLAPVFLHEKITKKIVFIIVLASIGLWVMLDGLSVQGDQLPGIAAGLFSGFAYAGIILLVRMHAQEFNPLVLTFLQNCTIAILLAPFVRHIPLGALWSYIFIGIVHSTVAPVLYFKGLRYVTANKAAVLGYLEPVCAIIFSMIFLKEIPGVHSIIGGVLIIFSGYLTLKDKHTAVREA